MTGTEFLKEASTSKLLRPLALWLPVFLAGSNPIDVPAFDASGGITAVSQLAGSDNDVSISGDLFLTHTWGNGEFLVYLEVATATAADSLFNIYPESNADAGSALDADDGGRIQVSELNYRFMLRETHEFTFGIIDPSSYFDRSRIANDENLHFIGASFVNNATIEFPDYTLGLVYRRPGTAGVYPTLTTVVAASDGLADNPGRSYRELIDISDGNKGLFIGSGLRWSTGDTRVGIGGWLRTDPHKKLANTGRDAKNYGVYAVYSWKADRQGINLRFGFANPGVSPAAGFAGLAYEYEPGIGLFGIGLAHIIQSNGRDSPDTGNTTHLETYYRIPLFSPRIHLTASFQYIRNPGFDNTNINARRDAFIAGLRLHAGFGD